MSKPNVNFIVTSSGAATLWFRDESGQRQYTVAADHPQHRKILEKLKVRDFAGLETLVSEKAAIAQANEELKAASDGSSTVNSAELVNGVVFVNGSPVHNVVSDRIVQLARTGFPVAPALRFLENLLENPSSRAVSELYDFLANRNLPLTEDGHFLAYKRIRQDWLDIYSGTIDNSIGQVVKIERNMVDDDRAHECSHGLHVGALEYVRWYGNSPGTRVVIVKVNPRDCVSVPRDHNHMKLRVCQYEVLYELPEGDRMPLDKPMYSTDGTAFAAVDDWVLEEADEDLDYVTEGWSAKNNYDGWSKDALAYECLKQGLTSTRQEGRDLGSPKMVELLKVSNLVDPTEDDDYDDYDVEEEKYDYDYEEDDCSCECVEELESVLPSVPSVGAEYVYVNPGKIHDEVIDWEQFLGQIVKVVDVQTGFVDMVRYSPGFFNDIGRMNATDFSRCFLKVKTSRR